MSFPRYRGHDRLSGHPLWSARAAESGSGEITSPRDNAIAAAYKFVSEATFFELAVMVDTLMPAL